MSLNLLMFEKALSKINPPQMRLKMGVEATGLRSSKDWHEEVLVRG